MSLPSDDPSRSARPIDDWGDLAPAFADAVRGYHSSRGRDANDPAVLATVQTNTELVPQRASNLLRLLERLTGRRSLQGQRVLEAGCGFGGLATYLAWRERPRETLGVDIRQDFVATANACTSGLVLGDRLRFSQADLRALPMELHESFDVVIANNSLVYLATAADLQRALRQLLRVLAPGGHLIVYQANRWTWRDPFTRVPLVHALPRPLAVLLAGAAGWQHSQGRVRLVAPPELRLRLIAAGFREVRTGGLRRGLGFTSHAALLRYYGAAARRPHR